MGASAHRMHRLGVAPILLLAAGCSLLGPEEPADMTGALFPNCVGPATPLDPAIAATLPAGDESSTLTNLKWMALAGRVPGGFAGIYLDNGVYVLRLVDVDQAPAAKTALAGVFDARFDIANAEVRAARWDYDQLADWSNYLWFRQGVSPGGSSGGVGVDVVGNRVVYYVEAARQRDRILRELATLDLPCGLVYIEVVGVMRDGSPQLVASIR